MKVEKSDQIIGYVTYSYQWQLSISHAFFRFRSINNHWIDNMTTADEISDYINHVTNWSRDLSKTLTVILIWMRNNDRKLLRRP